MNEDMLKGKWKQIEGDVQKKWGKLTHNDLQQIDGSLKQLEGKIQEKYGETKEKIEVQVQDFLSKFE